MQGQCPLTGWFFSWGLYVFLPLLILLFLVRILAKRNWKKTQEVYDKSWANQEKIISLLEQIRDTLKK